MEPREVLERLTSELEAVMNFWLAHSHDQRHGGFYNCLSADGKVYDTTKYGWLQGRQVWMYAKLYNTLPQYRTTQILESAIKGADFLMRCVKVPGQERCYFAVSEEGWPVRLQRKPYTECFYVMALSELHTATGEKSYQVAAEAMLAQIIYWIRFDDSGLGVPKLPGAPPAPQELGRPMMLLNILVEFCGDDLQLREKYSGDIEWSKQTILKHSDGLFVREYVLEDGSVLAGAQGRLCTPGHAMEAGWFLLQEAALSGNDQLRQTAIEKFIEAPYSYGTDVAHGGIFYFVDAEGHSPVQLEWSMKLWWVHCEAMVAFLMAYQATRLQKYWDLFLKVFQYSFAKFSEPGNGEWFGYLTQEGKVNQTFKGGPYKGCFHVPRSLLYCLLVLQQMQDAS